MKTESQVERHETPEYKEYQRLYYERKRGEIRAKQATYSKSNKTKKAEYDRARYQANKVEIQEKNRKHRLDNKESLNAKQRSRYKSNRNEIAAKASTRNKNNRQKENERLARWRKDNPVKAQAIDKRRKAALRGAEVRDLTSEQWQAIKEQYGFRCAYCGKRPERLTQDHIIPLSKGGHHTATNVVPACQSCNSRKGARVYDNSSVVV